MKISKELKNYILSHYASVPPEQGGILGIRDGVICEYIHDITQPSTDRAVYIPNTVFLNNCIEKWADVGIDFGGIVHSHPKGQDTLSSGDFEYIEKLNNDNPDLKKTFFPLVIGDCDIVVYAVRQEDGGAAICEEQIEIIN